MSSNDTITITDDEHERLLVPASPPGLFPTGNPDVFLARASETAGALARVIRDRKLYTSIRGKDHVHVEGWTLLGSLLGVFPVTEWTRPIDGGWEARVAARTRDGDTVGAAESMCTRSETRWRNADEYAIRSMAATRATSKALRLPLGFIVELAGFDATPADELPATPQPAPSNEPGSRAAPVGVTRPQLDQIGTLIRTLQAAQPAVDWKHQAAEIAGVPATHMTAVTADMLIRRLEQHLTEVAG